MLPSTKSSSSWKHYLQTYYIVNFLVLLIYPIHRIAGLSSPTLYSVDWTGFGREKTIISTFLLFVLLRYKKYCSVQHFVVTFLFYAKICSLCLYYLLNTNFFLGYGILIIRKFFFTSFMVWIKNAKPARSTSIY